MKQTRYLWVVAMAVAGVFLFSASALAGDIKARMTERLPKILELKSAGIVGENNQGFLAFVGDHRQEQAVVDAENRDRRLVYAAIAKQQGTTAAVVGQRRALQIAQKAGAGAWLQDAGGKWYRK